MSFSKVDIIKSPFDTDTDSSSGEASVEDESLFNLDTYPSVHDSVTEYCAEREHGQEATPNCSQTNESKWSKLPSLALEIIFLCSHRNDRCRMSAVCRNWFQEYTRNVSLWRSVTFVIPRWTSSSGIKQNILYVRKYGHMLHHVKIDCDEVSVSGYGHPVKLLLDALSKTSQLFSFSITSLKLFSRMPEDENFESIFQSTLDLLLSQNKLKSIDFSMVELNTPQAEEVLRVISLKHFATLKSLKLCQFICKLSSDFSAHLIGTLTTYTLFMNLKELFIYYSQMFEKIIMTFAECASSEYERKKTPSLESMKLFCNSEDSTSYNGIPPTAWECLTKLCPALKIDLIFYATGVKRMNNIIKKFIVPNMPIRTFQFQFNFPNFGCDKIYIGPVLHYLVSCKVSLRLEYLKITLMEYGACLASPLVYLLQECPQLRKVELCLLHPIDNLETVFNLLLENRPMSLEFVHISVKCFWKEAESNYLNLLDKYYPLLKEHGVKLRMNVRTSLSLCSYK